MAEFTPFRCIRPAGERAGEVAALPYDVFSRKEAMEEVAKNPLSFIAIDLPEINFPEDTDPYSPKVYERAAEIFWDRIHKGIYVTDDDPYYYVYELTWKGHVQTGLVGLSSVSDYENGIVKRHENTRKEKEEDRINHISALNAHTGPVFLAYRGDATVSEIIARVKEGEDIYDFTSDDGIRHRVFIIHDKSDIEAIKNALSSQKDIYIADGHHRAASAALVAKGRRAGDGASDSQAEHFLSVLFPGDELRILDYNRLLLSGKGHSPKEVLEEIEKVAAVMPVPSATYPETKGSFSLYIEGRWYICAFKKDFLNNDPVKGLDVSILQDEILAPVFGIADPTRDKNIDFVGGIRGLKELEFRVDNGAFCAFAMYPTAIEELFSVADAGLLMPPKSTWFEPKLRSGIFIHSLEETND